MAVCACPAAQQIQPLVLDCRGPGQQSVASDDDEDLHNPAMTFQSLEELPEPAEAAAAQEQEDAEHKVTEADKTGGTCASPRGAADAKAQACAFQATGAHLCRFTSGTLLWAHGFCSRLSCKGVFGGRHVACPLRKNAVVQFEALSSPHCTPPWAIGCL